MSSVRESFIISSSALSSSSIRRSRASQMRWNRIRMLGCAVAFRKSKRLQNMLLFEQVKEMLGSAAIDFWITFVGKVYLMKNIVKTNVLIVLGDKSRIKEKKHFWWRRRKKLTGNRICYQMGKPRIDLIRTESSSLYLCINFWSIVFLWLFWGRFLIFIAEYKEVRQEEKKKESQT